MKKLMTVVAASICAVSFTGFAEEQQELEEKTDKIFEAGVDLDFFSAYVWRNAVQNDEPVFQPCVWLDIMPFERFGLGFYVWQNYDWTPRRRQAFKSGFNETDYDIHLNAIAWKDEENSMTLSFQLGYVWYVNQWVRTDYSEDYADTSELYLKATFENEFVNVYGLAAWMTGDYGAYKQGMHYEIGLNKEFDLAEVVDIPEETLSLGFDWNVNFGDGRYLYYLYGGVDYVGDDEEDLSWSNPDAGIGGTTIKAYLTWSITEWMSLVGTIGYTGVLNGSARQELADTTAWQGDTYRRDLLWGGFSLKFSF